MDQYISPALLKFVFSQVTLFIHLSHPVYYSHERKRPTDYKTLNERENEQTMKKEFQAFVNKKHGSFYTPLLSLNALRCAFSLNPNFVNVRVSIAVVGGTQSLCPRDTGTDSMGQGCQLSS